jgi:hypothetical protein
MVLVGIQLKKFMIVILSLVLNKILKELKIIYESINYQCILIYYYFLSTLLFIYLLLLHSFFHFFFQFLYITNWKSVEICFYF